MKLARHAATVTALAVVAGGSALAFAAPASAAESAAPAAAAGPVAKYNGACGSGHKVIDFADMEKLGTTFLTYNKTTGDNCVVTVRTKSGPAVNMFASLSSVKGGKATDKGRFTTYAGPVYLHAPGECVTWEGGITTYSTKATGHCG